VSGIIDGVARTPGREGESAGILGEVKEFLDSLTLELPLVFSRPPAASRKPAKHIPYRGSDRPLWIVDQDPRPRRSEIREGEDGLRLVRGEDRAKPQAVLREWFSSRAREAFAERVAYWAPRLGVTHGRVTIRDQKTVWGSAARSGALSFNWRVLMAPPEVLDYLVIHELAHLREMNHSRRFWAIVAEHCPDWRRHRTWLRDHSRRLKAALRRG
jgi:hypothetical protein